MIANENAPAELRPERNKVKPPNGLTLAGARVFDRLALSF
jgi:hypothetical protein